MINEKKVQELNGERSLSRGVIITGAGLAIITLGGLIWFFLTSVK